MTAIHPQQSAALAHQSSTPIDGKPSVLGQIGSTVADVVKQCASNFAQNTMRICSGKVSELPLISAAVACLPKLAEGCYVEYKGVPVPVNDCCKDLGINYLNCAVDFLKQLPSNVLSSLLSQGGITLDQYNQATAGRGPSTTTSSFFPTDASVVTTAGGVPAQQSGGDSRHWPPEAIAIVAVLSFLTVVGGVVSRRNYDAAERRREGEVAQLKAQLESLKKELEQLLPSEEGKEKNFRSKLDEGIIAANPPRAEKIAFIDYNLGTAVKSLIDQLTTSINSLTPTVITQRAWLNPRRAFSDPGKEVIDAAKAKLTEVQANKSVVALTKSVNKAAVEILEHQGEFAEKDVLRTAIMDWLKNPHAIVDPSESDA